MRYQLLLTPLLVLLLASCVRAQDWQNFRFDHEGETVDMPTLMRATNTPAVSIALDYGGGDTTWTTTVSGPDISAATIFPVGAPSGIPLLVLVWQLVEAGKVDLDAPVNNYLKRTQLAKNRGKDITVRDLMHFKVKFNVGYKPDGYAAGEDRPAFVDLLRALEPRGVRKPDGNTNHGQWLPLQALVEDAYGEDLADLAERKIFEPLGLADDMFYATELRPAQLARVVTGHKENGTPRPGTYRRYVALGAHGLWATPRAYTRFIRAALDIRDGLTGSVLRPATVEAALSDTYGHRSLLFHVNDNGLPFGGGNARGYYFQLQAHPAEDWISVVALNRQLNWRLGGPVNWQAGMLAKQWRSADRLGIVLQPGEENSDMVRELEHYAFVNALRTERISAAEGLPAGITATPAFVFQSPDGRAVFSGRHASAEAVERFVRASRVSPKRVASDERTDVLTLKRGRQTIVMPLKLTSPAGTAAPAELPAELVTALRRELGAATGFTSAASVRLSALDRRVYLDVHPYRTASGDYQFTYALFSQFNCHEPVTTSFGKPVAVTSSGRGLEDFAARIAADVAGVLDPAAGFVPAALPADTPVRSWSDLGWELDQAVLAAQETAPAATPVAVSGTYAVSLTVKDAPGLFFSFPAPLDRYAGEVNQLDATFRFTDSGSRLSGQVDLPVAAISTGSGSLDTYVLGDILKSKKFPTASLVFSDVPVAQDWNVGRTREVSIPAELTVRGKTYPVTLAAAFTPTADGQLAATAAFGLDFKKVFNNDGPDGPDDIRRQLDFTAKLLVSPVDTAR